ncbi:hypothetical protein [Virgibacillus sp. YIM 98842]|nr:hypothetical protein [Virgibacillus sp. YIM 98842]
MAVIEISAEGLLLTELLNVYTAEEVIEATGAALSVAENVK